MNEEKDMKIVNQEEPVVPRTNSEKEAVTNRLKRIEGQVRGLQKMVDEVDIVLMCWSKSLLLKQH